MQHMHTQIDTDRKKDNIFRALCAQVLKHSPTGTSLPHPNLWMCMNCTGGRKAEVESWWTISDMRFFSRSTYQASRPLLHLCNSLVFKKLQNIYRPPHWECKAVFSVRRWKASQRSHESFSILLGAICNDLSWCVCVYLPVAEPIVQFIGHVAPTHCQLRLRSDWVIF